MKIIAVAMQKGGVGKSTVTRSLAVAAAQAGLNVLALDMDTQQSTALWAKRRGKEGELPLVEFITEIALEERIEKARKGGCDLIIIDTPPARSSEAPAAVEAADLVLIPCTPDIEAYEQIDRTARLARTSGKPAFAVLTMAQPNSHNEESVAREVFRVKNLPMADAVIHRFKVHRDASREGVTAQEMEPKGKASKEIAALWNWVYAELQNSKTAIMHKKRSK